MRYAAIKIGMAAAVMCLPVALMGQSQDQGRLALVNGEVISAAEVQSEAADDLKSLDVRKQQFDVQFERDKKSVLEDALNKVVERRILTAEAAKRKITVDDLLQLEVEGAAKPPSDEEVVAFYNANKDRIQGSLGENAADIVAYLREQRKQTIFDTLMTRLRKDYSVQSFLEPMRTTIEISGHPTKGPANAPITIAEFSDFECPYCGALFPTLQRIEEDYKEKLRIVYLQFPLSNIHPHAEKSAEASLCAHEQDKFWPMHDAMFADQRNLTNEDLKQKASTLSLDTAKFNACLDAGKYVEDIRKDVGQGTRAGVNGTPAMFINGRYLSGNQPYTDIKKMIDDELERAARK